ncbi:uncharacterized protein CMC5_022610 [Chondromyces crocatus]|uniref:Uncharacterized protein n=1 Tax=Chondromyces crocatus TaxID=52 RepID=A0A0K1EB98_CHOCO|nr:uncharacterized protein CMC5_022610 [Chondromyces crocatus]
MVGACKPPSHLLATVLQRPSVPIPERKLDLGIIPPRPDRAPGGSQFWRDIVNTDESRRESAILEELRRGNLPESHRKMVRLDYKAESRSGHTHSVSLWVMPDYLAVGDDGDAMRVPMSPVTAQLVADRFGCVLPTSKLVDIIYRLAPTKLTPYPMPVGDRMVRMEEFARHSRIIDKQLDKLAVHGLVAGHKKDIVLTNRLDARPHRVAIYGWHHREAKPIQQLSTKHGDWYADYSHGVRLLSSTMLLDDQPIRVQDALTDPELASLLSDEGPLAHTRYRTEDGIGHPPPRPLPATYAAVQESPFDLPFSQGSRRTQANSAP